LEQRVAQAVIADAEHHVVAIVELDGAMVLERLAWQMDLSVDVLPIFTNLEDKSVISVIYIGAAYAKNVLA
jgi:hypothetical protein